MKFPEEYIIHGRKRLHSGQDTEIFYDVNALLTDSFYLNYVINNIPFSRHYVGIATGGAIIAALLAREKNTGFSMIKDGELKGKPPDKEWSLIDDVVTTGSSLEEAINIIGKNPSSIWVVVDRRTEASNLLVNSIFEI